jgi:hypothetical protein
MSRARPRWLAVAVLAALSAGCGAVAQAASSPARDAVALGAARSAARSAAANQEAAQTDAASLLAKLNLPAGATRQAGEPAGDGGTLGQPGSGTPVTPNVVDDAAWWVVPGTTQQLVQYVDEHPPAGGQPSLSGQSSGGGGPTVTDTGFAWPGVSGQLSLRSLVVAVVQLQNGSTAVRADSQVVWITPRLRSERIPPGARRVIVTTTKSGKLVEGPFTVTARAKVAKIVSLLNALPAFQPGTYSCPADFGWQIRVVFYRAAATSSTAPLAVALIDPGGCGAVQLRLAGKRQHPLAGGYALTKQLSGVLRVKLDSGVP